MAFKDKRFISPALAIPWHRMIPYRLLMVSNVAQPEHMAKRYLVSMMGTPDAAYTVTLFMGLS